LAGLYNEISPAGRPEVVAALAKVTTAGDPLLTSLLAEDKLNQWIVEWAKQ
jgi:hypothetical protein